MQMPASNSRNPASFDLASPQCVKDYAPKAPTVRPTDTTPLQLAVLRALDEHLGVAPESTLLTFLEATSVWTRESGRYAVAELLAMGLLWREGLLLGLTSEACSLVA